MIRAIDYLALSIGAAAIAWTLSHQLALSIQLLLDQVTRLL